MIGTFKNFNQIQKMRSVTFKRILSTQISFRIVSCINISTTIVFAIARRYCSIIYSLSSLRKDAKQFTIYNLSNVNLFVEQIINFDSHDKNIVPYQIFKKNYYLLPYAMTSYYLVHACFVNSSD